METQMHDFSLVKGDDHHSLRKQDSLGMNSLGDFESHFLIV